VQGSAFGAEGYARLSFATSRELINKGLDRLGAFLDTTADKLLVTTALIALALPPWGDFQSHSHWDRIGWVPFASPPVKVSDIEVRSK